MSLAHILEAPHFFASRILPASGCLGNKQPAGHATPINRTYPNPCIHRGLAPNHPNSPGTNLDSRNPKEKYFAPSRKEPVPVTNRLMWGRPPRPSSEGEAERISTQNPALSAQNARVPTPVGTAASAVQAKAKPSASEHTPSPLATESRVPSTVHCRVTPLVTSDLHQPRLLSNPGRFSRRNACAFRQFGSLPGCPVSFSPPPHGMSARTLRRPSRPKPKRRNDPPQLRHPNCTWSAPPYPALASPPPSPSPSPLRLRGLKSTPRSVAKLFQPSPAATSAKRVT